MKIEQKKLTDTATLLFFTAPLPLIGTFYYPKDEHPLLQNISEAGLAETLLLTADFLYLESKTPADLPDLEMLAIAEIDDYASSVPSQLTAPNTNTEAKISLILKLIIAPFLQKDGGDIKLGNYDNGIVSVRFLGKCNGCPYATKTLKERVEKNLIRYLPEVKEAVLI